MRKWKIGWLLATLLVLALFLAACDSASEEPAAAEEEVAEAPAAPAGDKWCGDTDIVFFPGGCTWRHLSLRLSITAR